MENMEMDAFINSLILLYSYTAKSLEKVQEVTKKFDGKVINRRYTSAVWDATKDENVGVCVSKDSGRGWVYRTVLYAGTAWKVYGDAVYYGYQVKGKFPDECFIQRDGKAPRINGKAVVDHLDTEIENLSRRAIALEDYSNLWPEEVETYNRLCRETFEIVKKFPGELADYIRLGKVGVNFQRPWYFD